MPITKGSMAASTSALITPTIDEVEQKYFYSSGELHHQEHCCDAVQQQQTFSRLESIIDESLPYFSFYSPDTADTLNYCIESHGNNTSVRVESLASSATASVSPLFVEPNDGKGPPCTTNANDVMHAAGILCQFKNDAIMECYSLDAAELVDMAVDMLADDDSTVIDEEHKNCWDSARQSNERVSDSLDHPNRLAIDEDAEEVNKLHQYVRKELLEIFVVPQQTSASDDADSEDEDDEDSTDDIDDEDDESVVKDKSKDASDDTINTRHLVTRRRSIVVSSSPPSSYTQRYYPGRVGLRCTYCANVRRKSTSKAAFYPLRLKNIYREVCAWQRIHFKKCPHVPDEVRERYDHYKKIDTSRGKVRYWESSARKIGLENNPHR